jgi:hypothetical protein
MFRRSLPSPLQGSILMTEVLETFVFNSTLTWPTVRHFSTLIRLESFASSTKLIFFRIVSSSGVYNCWYWRYGLRVVMLLAWAGRTLYFLIRVYLNIILLQYYAVDAKFFKRSSWNMHLLRITVGILCNLCTLRTKRNIERYQKASWNKIIQEHD